MGIRSGGSALGALPSRADVPPRRRTAAVLLTPRHLLACLCIALAAGCEGAARPDDGPAVPDSAAAAPEPGSDSIAAADRWREAGGIQYEEQHALDLTGDGLDERVIARALGPTYDSLDVSITIVSARGDTLWREAWPSLLYFKYDPIEGKADSTVSRMVRDHVEHLVARERFTMDGGLPAALSRGGNVEREMREAVRYHLAELDYRLGADLTPADGTPPGAFERIDAASVPATRVDAVLDEVRQHPSFTYYAGGEATYTIAWSAREHAFVRIYSCC